jgi:ribosomal protein S18 acetylase RimI-like enzyme
MPHDRDPSSIYLISMWVRPAARGSGAADALIGAVIAWAERQGASAVVLDVGQDNLRARRAYERHGFRATGHVWRRERDGVIEVHMRRPLGAGS